MVDFDLKRRQEKIESLSSRDEQLSLIWNWIKQEKINKRQFTFLLNYLLEAATYE